LPVFINRCFMALFSIRGFTTTYRPQVSGTNGDDTLFAIAGRGAVYAGEGNDFVAGTNSHDILFGGNGDDLLLGHGGNDRLYGEDGNDYIDSGSGMDTVYGGIGDDVLVGTFGNFTQLHGEDGNDIIYGGHTDNLMSGGAGDDALHIDGNLANPSGSSASLLHIFAAGGEGSDTLVFDSAIDVASLQAFTQDGSYETLFIRWTGSDGSHHSGKIDSIEWIDVGNGVESIMNYVVA